MKCMMPPMVRLCLLIGCIWVGFTLSACSENEQPAAKAKQALDAAQQAADDTAVKAKEMAEQSQKMLNP